MAAVLLAALVASLSLISHPSGGASASTVSTSLSAANAVNITAKIHYGCGTDGSADASASPTPDAPSGAFVEVTLTRFDHTDDGDDPPVLQVGLTDAADTADQNLVHGGPTSVTVPPVSSVTVRLAGTVADGDRVFVSDPDNPGHPLWTRSLPANCNADTDPTVVTLIKPTLSVQTSCPVRTVQGVAPVNNRNVSVAVSVNNHNDGSVIDDLGLVQLDYTVLLVPKQTPQLNAIHSAQDVVSFVEKATDRVVLSQIATPDPYEVRVIGVDGQIVTKNVTLSCNAASAPKPPPSSTPSKPSKPPVTTPPPVTTAPTTTHTVSSPSASPTPSTPSAAPTTVAGIRSRVTPSVTSSGSAVANSSPPAGVSGGAVQQNAGTPQTEATDNTISSSVAGVGVLASPPATTTHTSVTSPADATPSSTHVVEIPQAGTSAVGGGLGIFGTKQDLGLIVVIFLAAMSGLVGSSVLRARRR